jgi:hypothetical protein
MRMFSQNLETVLAIVNLGWAEFMSQRGRRYYDDMKLSTENMVHVADAACDMLLGKGFSVRDIGENPILHAFSCLGTVLQGMADFETPSDIAEPLEMVQTFVLTVWNRDDLSMELVSRYIDIYVALAVLADRLTDPAFKPGVSVTWSTELTDWQFGQVNSTESTRPRAAIPHRYGWLTNVSGFGENVLVPLVSKFILAESEPASDAHYTEENAVFLCPACSRICLANDRWKGKKVCHRCGEDFYQTQLSENEQIDDDGFFGHYSGTDWE